MTVSSIRTDGGGDYTSIQAWEDDCPSDITAGGTNENWEGELANEEFLDGDGRCTFGGITTDATHKLILRPASGAGFADNVTPSTGPLRYDSSLGAAIRNTANYSQTLDFGDSATVRCDLIGLQIRSTATNSKCLRSQGSQPVRAFGCIFDGGGTGGSSGSEVIFVRNTSGDRPVLENCAIIGISAPRVIKQSNALINFCTFYGGTDHTDANYTLGDFTNCLFLDSTGFQNDSVVNVVDYCVTDLSSWDSSSATNSVLNATASDEIESDTSVATTVDLRAKSGGSSDGGGTPISGITTDIYGQTRDVSTPTVGAFELVAAGGTITGSGTPASQSATTSGTGSVSGTITGSGTPQSQSSTVSGTGTIVKTSSGALQSQGSTTSGTASIVKTGSGALQSQDSTTAGSGTVGGVIAGSGTPQSQSATSSGTATIVKTGSGALQSQSSTTSGSGTVGVITTGSGVLIAQGSTASGTGVIKKTATGALQAQSSTTSGAGTMGRTASGALQSQSSTTQGNGRNTGTQNCYLVLEAPIDGTGVSGSGTIDPEGAYVVGLIDGNGVNGDGIIDSNGVNLEGALCD